MAVSEEALKDALKRLTDFRDVQAGQEKKGEALSLMFESLGFGEAHKEALFEWVSTEIPKADDGSILIGLLIGLLVNQHYQDKHGLV